MKNYIIILFISLFLCEESSQVIRDYTPNGVIDAAISSNDINLVLVQIDAVNDSLLSLANMAVNNLELLAGAASYHRIINTNQYERLQNVLTPEYLYILDSDYEYPDNRDYWVHTIHGDGYYGSSGEIGDTCYCLNSSGCVVVGFNDSWYDPFDYYGEAWWNFQTPAFDQVTEARVYVQGAQCDALPVWSETDVSIRNNSCSWNSNFQATLSIDYTLNGPYIIPVDQLENIWCEGNLQPIVGSEDNYTVDFVRIELFYSCSEPEGITNFTASNEEYCDYVELNWTLDETSTSGYTLYRDGELVMQFSSETSQHLDYQSIEGVSHEYCIYSNNNCGQSEADCTIGKRKGDPSQIENVNASDGDYQNQIIIQWDQLSEEVLYKLYRDGIQLTVLSSNQELIYTDQFVETQIIYEYCIEATNDCGTSIWSCDSGFVGIGELGDINLDTVIDIIDIILLLNFILEVDTPNEDQIWLSDINSDQVINILDIVALVNLILGT